MGYSVYGERIFVDRADYDRAVEVMRGADAGGGETLADVPEWEDAAGDEPYGKDEQRERRVKAWILVLFITGGLAAAVMGIVFMFFF